MEIATQLSVFLENKPGTLAAVCNELAKQKINIYAFTISDTSDHAVVRMLVSDPVKATHLLEERGVLVVENKVLTFESTNKPGSLAKVASKLGAAKVNIEYAYFATGLDGESGLMVLRVSDTKKAIKTLKAKK